MKSSVLGSGGSAAFGGGLALVGTLGQPVIGLTTSSGLTNSQGFWYTVVSRVILGVHEEHSAVTGSLQLSQNFPNPFTTTTKLNLTIPTSGRVSLKLYDALGREVQKLIDDVREAGTITVTITTDETMSSGRYTAVLLMGQQRRAVTMSLVK